MTRAALTPRQADALGALFAAEIKAAGKPRQPLTRTLPLREAKQLVAIGLVYRVSERIPAFAGLTMIVTGYRLTTAGHFAYCAWAADQPEEEEP